MAAGNNTSTLPDLSATAEPRWSTWALSTATLPNTGFLSIIPIEVMDRILTLTNPETVSAFSQTKRTYHSYTQGNTYLWRSLYLQCFDDPRTDTNSLVNWQDKVQRRTRAQHVANAGSASAEDVESALATLIDVVKTARPGVSEGRSVAWLNQRIPSRFISPVDGETLSQARAQLHVLLFELLSGCGQRLVSQSYVYDWRNYKRSNLFGPFLPRCRGSSLQINYIHLWHLINAQSNEIRLLRDGSGDSPSWTNQGLDAVRSMTAPPSPVEGDWAGVEGEWIRLVCWMNYSDFEEYNWPDGERASRDTVLDNSIFQQPGFMELHTTIRVGLRVVSIEKASDQNLRPKIHFEGISIGGGINESSVEGFVSDEGNGVIRWHLQSIVGGAAKWQTEGTQIGGVQSAAGWVGCWTDPEHGEWDPAGPNWSYKFR